MSNSALGSQSIALLTLPAGTLVDYAGTVEPSGWLLCDGRAVSRTVYASLFSALGTAYGTGDGSTTFNIPDFRGRFARYMDNMGTAQGAASRDTGRVLGAAQTQATAKNGLTNSSSSASVDTGAIRLVGASTATTFASGAAGAIEYSPNQRINTNIISGTASAQTITGDTETRPINLSCNKLIKI
jgi:microcystin-dependent protein